MIFSLMWNYCRIVWKLKMSIIVPILNAVKCKCIFIYEIVRGKRMSVYDFFSQY